MSELARLKEDYSQATKELKETKAKYQEESDAK
jgi:hypothetical protein